MGDTSILVVVTSVVVFNVRSVFVDLFLLE